MGRGGPYFIGADGAVGPEGAMMQMEHRGDQLRGRILLDVRHQGVPGVAHGGALAALVDEAGGAVLMARQEWFVTANLSIDYLAPVRIGEELEVVASLARSAGRKRWVEVDLLCREEPVARGRLLFLTVEAQHFEELGVERAELVFGDPANGTPERR